MLERLLRRFIEVDFKRFMRPEKLPVTVVIPTRNEAGNLPACLGALGAKFEEVWVVDSFSTDRTPEVAASHGARLMNFDWKPWFPKKRNWVLSEGRIATPWVWFLDADEMVTPRLLREVARHLSDDSCAGIARPVRRWWGSRPLRFARKRRKTCLFRVGRGEYVPFPDDCWSQKDVEVFEPVRIDGRVVRVRACLEERNVRGTAKCEERIRHDSAWEAGRCFWLRSSGPDVWAGLEPREAARYRMLDAPWAGWEVWVRDYLLHGGFLDGVAGWRYHQVEWRLRREMRKRLMRR